MTRITQIDDRVGALAWSPVASAADVVVVGTKDSGGKIGFDDYGGELEVYNLNLTSSSGESVPSKVASGKTVARFSSIGWTSYGGPTGLIGGGMSDGTVQIWDASQVLAGTLSSDAHWEPLVTVPKRPNGDSVTALQFCPHLNTEESKLMAIGLSSGEFVVLSLEDPSQPTVLFSSFESGEATKGAPITNISWNSQVSHIVASASGDGFVTVWDLRQRKKWCEIRCEPGSPVSALAWNPTEGLHMITASGDDRHATLKLWDLRASTQMPIATLEGHHGGVLALAWCPHDPTLILSTAKDNKTFLWDLYTMKAIDEIPNEAAASQTMTATSTEPSLAASMYGGNLDNSTQLRFDVQWSPIRRGVVSTCSFDRKVQIHSIGASGGRAPGWLKRGSSLSTGMGGALISVTSLHRGVAIDKIVEQPELVQASMEFEQAVASQNFLGYCSQKAVDAATTGDDYEAQVWGFMQILFEQNSRAEILNYLGFDRATIAEQVSQFNEQPASAVGMNGDMSEVITPMSHEAKDVVQKALLVGDFEAAVQCCIKAGSYADALVLASCGGGDLWSQTQAAFFAKEATQRPFLSIVHAVIHSQLGELVSQSDPEKWQETLAILSTYAKAEEFAELCRALGDRVESVGDYANASLCYMCANDLNQASKYWKQQYDEIAASSDTVDVKALHNFVEKVTIFMYAPNHVSAALDESVSALFNTYSRLLAEQGCVDSAAKYCRGDSQEGAVLCDLLYNCGAATTAKQIMGAKPPVPFQVQQINVAPKRTAAQVQSQQQQPYQQQQQQQQQSYAQTDALPPGWQALQDPSSGRTYYANSVTGESTWEKPAMLQQQQKPPAAAAQPATTGNQYAQPNGSTYSNTFGAAQPQTQQQPSQNGYMAANTSFASQNAQQSQPQTQPTSQFQPAQATQYQPQTQPNMMHQPQQMQMQQQPSAEPAYSQPTGSAASSRAATPSKVASRYGDGFISSSSRPGLGEQYGNVGTSNPYSVDSVPSIAKVPGQAPAPVSGTFDPTVLDQLTPEQQTLSNDLTSYVSTLSSMALTFSEKKQLGEVEKAVTILSKKMARGGVDDSVLQQVTSMAEALRNRNYAGAQSAHTNLVNHEWSNHKDWLRGLKLLIQLCMKRLS